MNIEYLANMAEITSGILVVVTLIFLVIQIRANTKALRMNALNTHYTDMIELTGDGVRVPELATAAQKAFAGQPLDAIDKYYLNNWTIRTCNLIERHIHAMHEGFLDQKTFDRSVLQGKHLLRTPAGRTGYELLKDRQLFAPELTEYVDNFFQEVDREAGQQAAQQASDPAD